MAPTYELIEAEGVRAIRCLLCGAVSANANDRRQRYCGRCHLFHDDVYYLRGLVATRGSGHDCSDWRTARGVCALCDRQAAD